MGYEKKNKERELNKLKKDIEKAEKEIAELESEIATLEKKMNDPEFYNASNNGEVFTRYNNLKEMHEKKMEAWENMQLVVDEKSRND